MCFIHDRRTLSKVFPVFFFFFCIKFIQWNKQVLSLKADRRQRNVSEQKPYTICALAMSCMETHTYVYLKYDTALAKLHSCSSILSGCNIDCSTINLSNFLIKRKKKLFFFFLQFFYNLYKIIYNFNYMYI